MDAIAASTGGITSIDTGNSRFQLSYVNGICISGACSYPSNLAGNPFCGITVTDITHRYGPIRRYPDSTCIFSLNLEWIIPYYARTNIREGISADSNIAFPIIPHLLRASILIAISTSFSIITDCNILVPIAVRKMTNSNSTAMMSIHIAIIRLRPHTKSNIVALSSCSLGYDSSLRINNT